MNLKLPGAVPEVPVESIDRAVAYYVDHLAFQLDWSDDASGIAGISKGDCRLFLASPAFREARRNTSPVVIWLNLNSKLEVDSLHAVWNGREAKIVSPPESKPWNLHEFTVADLDGNFLRVFYDFSKDK